jgi:hypothetical protein
MGTSLQTPQQQVQLLQLAAIKLQQAPVREEQLLSYQGRPKGTRPLEKLL